MVNGSRLDKKIIQKMRQLRKRGYSYKYIASSLKVNYCTVLYHLNEKHRERVKKFGRLRKYTPERKEYFREYMNTRYKKDPKFREKIKKRSRSYKRKQISMKRRKNENN
ncbi:MAG: hypothetical protein KKB31_04460 [Nanoarchaeota archaeon]|nr:hypothetical protein [Nanoarchaeota archaeon]